MLLTSGSWCYTVLSTNFYLGMFVIVFELGAIPAPHREAVPWSRVRTHDRQGLVGLRLATRASQKFSRKTNCVPIFCSKPRRKIFFFVLAARLRRVTPRKDTKELFESQKIYFWRNNEEWNDQPIGLAQESTEKNQKSCGRLWVKRFRFPIGKAVPISRDRKRRFCDPEKFVQQKN